MHLQQDSICCRYEYDPLDRLIGLKPSEKEGRQRFYCDGRLVTEIQGLSQCSIMQQSDQLLAQQLRRDESVETNLLVTDRMSSVLHMTGKYLQSSIAYTPYGHFRPEIGLTSMLAFNGERRDLFTGCYLLGNGYRAFNPVLKRFNSPDSLSPFGKGGLNSYAYCLGDPVNMSDPTGNVAWFNLTTREVMRLSGIARAAGRSSKGFFPEVNFPYRGGRRRLPFGQDHLSKSINHKEVGGGPKKLSALAGEVIREYADELEMAPGLRKVLKSLSPSNRDALEEFSKSRKSSGTILDLPDKFGVFNKQHKIRKEVHEQITTLSSYATAVRTSFSPSNITDLQSKLPGFFRGGDPESYFQVDMTLRRGMDN
ncbi:RHS repeat-associated core domain-containing protein [Pseudomonas sp. NFX224]|uniref:RHS repeat-associated core domain-containing protein n=1 Tax=Pseudomonas sp. NFX224 TaxID=3402862 RepID=UPI003AFA6B7B